MYQHSFKLILTQPFFSLLEKNIEVVLLFLDIFSLNNVNYPAITNIKFSFFSRRSETLHTNMVLLFRDTHSSTSFCSCTFPLTIQNQQRSLMSSWEKNKGNFYHRHQPYTRHVFYPFNDNIWLELNYVKGKSTHLHRRFETFS